MLWYPAFILVLLAVFSAVNTNAAAASFTAPLRPHHRCRIQKWAYQSYATTTSRSTISTTRAALPLLRMTAESTPSAASVAKRRKRPVFLTHERDFFRQQARLNSMDSYVLVSTLTASMSFGCLVGFSPHSNSSLFYRALCMAVQVVSGLSAIFGLYATIIFSLTILYGKSALGAERDREYDKFLRRTVRSRVHGARCFSLSLALFALEALLVLVERTYLHPISSVTVGCVGAVTLCYLYRDWKLLHQSKSDIFKD